MPNWTMMDPERQRLSAAQDVETTACSSAQKRFWRIDREDPGTPALNIAVKWQIHGHFDTAIARDAFQAVIERHETLRSALALAAGEPMQAIAGQVPFKISEIDFSWLAEPERRIESDRIAALEARTRFDLTTAPLLRATLLRLGRSDAVLLVTAHHMVSDSWSMGVIARDFVAAYRDLARGDRPQLAPLPLQYAEFAQWHGEAVADGMLAREERYWTSRLAELPVVAVPVARPRSAAASCSGAAVSRLLPRAMTKGLADVAREEGASFFVAAYAVLLALLKHRTGASDIVVTTQIAGRDEVELEGLVGPFVNTLALRTQLAPLASFRQILDAARETFEDAIDHGQWPFDRIDPRDQSTGGPAISVNLLVQRAFVGELANESFQLVGISSPLPGALYDLNFVLVERRDGWRLTCEYRTDLYEEATAKDLVAEFEAIADAALGDPSAPLPAALPPPPVAPARAVVAIPVAPAPDPAPPFDPGWVRATWLRKTGAQPALFAINHTALNQHLYRPLSRELGPDQPLLTLQILDDSGAWQPSSIEELAAAYCRAIVATRREGPYRIAGFCRSGVIAYEVARQLTAAGHEVELLVLIDCWAPGYYVKQSRLARTRFRLRRAGRFVGRLWAGGPRHFVTRMWFTLRSTGTLRKTRRLMFWRQADEKADEADLWRATDLLEALVQPFTVSGYAGRVILFRSDAIPAGWPPDPALGWTGRLTWFEQFPLPGQGHEGAFSQAGSRIMAAAIAEALPAGPVAGA